MLPGEAENEAQERGGGVEARPPLGKAERRDSRAASFQDAQHRVLPRIAGQPGPDPGVRVDGFEHPEGEGTDRLSRGRALDRLRHRTGDDVIGGGREKGLLVGDVSVDRPAARRQPHRQRGEGQAVPPSASRISTASASSNADPPDGPGAVAAPVAGTAPSACASPPGGPVRGGVSRIQSFARSDLNQSGLSMGHVDEPCDSERPRQHDTFRGDACLGGGEYVPRPARRRRPARTRPRWCSVERSRRRPGAAPHAGASTTRPAPHRHRAPHVFSIGAGPRKRGP